MRIGIDLMGGDFFPSAPVEGVIQAQKKSAGMIKPVLIGDREIIIAELLRQGVEADAFEIIHTSQVIEMGESPTKAITAKPDCSINVGMRMVKEGKIDAFVSAGNTGAMLVSSSLVLGNIPGVARPAIAVLFPSHSGKLTLLVDIGANIDAKPEYLVQFAQLGSEFMEDVMQVNSPKIALLNVGEEKGKGTQSVKEAYLLLEKTEKISFVGNVEGRDIFSGKADVLVCDGFTGNIVLKFAESMYENLKDAFGENEPFIQKFNFENYGGVPVLGINGVVMIGHGISNGKAFSNMIFRAAEAVEKDLTGKIKKAFEA